MTYLKLILLAAALLILANMNIQITTGIEFEGPLHNIYVDHIRHHQAEKQSEFR